MALLDLTATVESGKISYIEMTPANAGTLVGGMTLRQAILGDEFTNNADWNQQPIFQVTESSQSFSEAGRTVISFHTVTNKDGTRDIVLTSDLERVIQVEREEVRQAVPWIRDPGMRHGS